MTEQNDSSKKPNGFWKTFIGILIIVIAIAGFVGWLITSLPPFKIEKIVQNHGYFVVFYVWGITIIFITSLFTILKYIRNKKLLKILLISISTIIYILLGYFAYVDSHKTNVKIISEIQIYEVKFENRSNNEIFTPGANRVGNSNIYELDKRLPFGDYNITVFLSSEPPQFFTRTFKSRNDTLTVF